MKRITVKFGTDSVKRNVDDHVSPSSVAGDPCVRIALGYHKLPVRFKVEGDTVEVEPSRVQPGD